MCWYGRAKSRAQRMLFVENIANLLWISSQISKGTPTRKQETEKPTPTECLGCFSRRRSACAIWKMIFSAVPMTAAEAASVGRARAPSSICAGYLYRGPGKSRAIGKALPVQMQNPITSSTKEIGAAKGAKMSRPASQALRSWRKSRSKSGEDQLSSSNSGSRIAATWHWFGSWCLPNETINSSSGSAWVL